jgi:hypothetical protein
MPGEHGSCDEEDACVDSRAHQKGRDFMQNSHVKRRDFLTRSALALLGATTRGDAAASTRSLRSEQAAQPASGEPIIDIHQHLGYENAKSVFRL